MKFRTVDKENPKVYS